MYFPVPLKEDSIQSLWDYAYEHGVAVVKVSNPEHPINLRVALNRIENHRRRVRILRLNPFYKDKWNRIRSCRVKQPVLGQTYIKIERKTEVFIAKKLVRESYNYPLTKLNLPTGVSNGKNQYEARSDF